MLRLRADQMIALSGPALTHRIVLAPSDRYPLETMAMSRTALTTLVRVDHRPGGRPALHETA